MIRPAERLLQLLPAFYALRDRERAVVTPGMLAPEERRVFRDLLQRLAAGAVLSDDERERLSTLREQSLAGPLASLLAILAEPLALLEEDLEQLYDDQFIETCAAWVVPYLGDLIGYRPRHSITGATVRARAEVAHTIGYRRRKGTLGMLRQVARDVTGWDALAVEYFQRLITTQYVNHPRPSVHAAPDLRRWRPLERVATAFDSIPRTVDVRRVESGRGRYNIPNVGLFLWRIQARSLTRSPAPRVDARRYRFHPLGVDQPLFSNPRPVSAFVAELDERNVPIPITRRRMAEQLRDFYSDDDLTKSVRVYINRGAGFDPVRIDDVMVCHLGDHGTTWAHLPPAGKVAIDPMLGRLALPPDATEAWDVEVDFHYGFPAEVGGGEYERERALESSTGGFVRVPDAGMTLQQAIDSLAGDGVVEITDSGRYEGAFTITVADQKSVEIRAANERRPLLVLTAPLSLRGGERSEIRLNGLLVAGNRLHVPSTDNGLSSLRIAHCTLVPGWSLTPDLSPRSPAESSLLVERMDCTVELERSISGPLRVVQGADVRVVESILDALGQDAFAFTAPDRTAGARLCLESCTVIGRIEAHELLLVSNSILLARSSGAPPVRAEFRQEGCIRFSWLPATSRTPRRHRCLPESASSPSEALPRFHSLRYGSPAYGLLAASSGRDLLTGADDESEPGLYHLLAPVHREVNLRVRLDEYLRVGLQAGVFYET